MTTKAKAEPEKKEIITGLTLEDFMADTNLSTPSKLILNSNEKETDQYIMIIGAQSNKVTRSRLTWGLKTQALSELLKTIDDDIDRAVRRIEEEREINNEFAIELMVGWSFGDYEKTKAAKLLSDNPDISDGVISFSFARESTLEKK